VTAGARCILLEAGALWRVVAAKKGLEGRTQAMNRPTLHSSAFWRQCAEEAHVRADEMRDGDARRTMRQIARMYRAMASRMEVRELEVRFKAASIGVCDTAGRYGDGATRLH
jgi:hypothetical protein